MAVNLEILAGPLGGSRLVDDYVDGATDLASFFAGHPHDPAAYRRKADEVRRRFTPDALGAVADAAHVPTPARDRWAAAVGGEGFLVTTGQQPGLFGGPLYTIHKALSAIALARELETVLEAPVLALFWVASDDHDWAEANHTYLLDPRNDLHRVELTGPAGAPVSMGRRRVPAAPLESALDELRQLLPPSDFTPGLLERLERVYSGATVAGAFGALLAELFRELPLAIVDAQAPAVRAAGLPVIRRELERSAAHESALARQTERLESLGYGAQVPVLPGASNVFHEDDEGRERLMRDREGWVLRRSRRRWSPAELERLLEAEPERFSPNVVLRPVVESAVFPTLAYVGGPGEVSYLAQTGCVFEAHGVGMPLVFPRLSVTLVEGKVRKVLDKFGLEPGSFTRPTQEIVADVIREEVPAPVSAAVTELRRSLQEGYASLHEAAKAIDPTLKGPILHARGEGFRSLSEVERKIRQHLKSRNETELEQLEKAAANVAPGGKPQERVLNVHQYLARYGNPLLPSILAAMEVRVDRDPGGWTGVSCDS